MATLQDIADHLHIAKGTVSKAPEKTGMRYCGGTWVRQEKTRYL